MDRPDRVADGTARRGVDRTLRGAAVDGRPVYVEDYPYASPPEGHGINRGTVFQVLVWIRVTMARMLVEIADEFCICRNMPPPGRRLNNRQELFVQGIVAGKTQIRAYLDAGYRDGNGAESGASELRSNPKIAAEIEKRTAKVAKKSEWTRERVLEGLLAEAEGREDSTPASRVQAWTAGAKIAGLVIEKFDHSGKIGSYVVALPPESDSEDAWQAEVKPT